MPARSTKRLAREAVGLSMTGALPAGEEVTLHLKGSGPARALVLLLPSSCTKPPNWVFTSGPTEAPGGAAGAQLPEVPVTPACTTTATGVLGAAPSLTTRIA